MQFAHKYRDPKGNRQKSVIADICDYFIVSTMRSSHTKIRGLAAASKPLIFVAKRVCANPRTHELALTVVAAVQANISNRQSNL